MSNKEKDTESTPVSENKTSTTTTTTVTESTSSTTETNMNSKQVEEMRSNLARMLLEGSRNDTQKDKSNKVTVKEHKFWSTQPVVQHSQERELKELGSGTEIETKTIEEISKKPYPLIDGFEWSEININDEKELEETYKLLNLNYVEDGECMFRFDYRREFLKWALLPPGWKKSWHLGVRVKSSQKLVAFITAVPATIKLHSNDRKVVEINFLCVHKKLRSKRLAPVLIREITRRVNLCNIWQAVYTAGIVLPRPISSSFYFHRSLNPKKLIDVGFSRLSPRMTMARTIKLYALKSETSTPGIRPMEARDVPMARNLLAKYFEKYNLYTNFSEDEFAHWLLPREGVIYSYVVEDLESKAITDMISFYNLPSSIIQHPNYKTLNAAYSFCNAPMKTPIVDLMRDALILAKRNNFDVFNALDLAENAKFFRELHFHIGDGMLHYYLYNWKCKPIENTQNALVLL